MATLNENVAKVKESFRNIKGCVNTKYGEYLENEERIESGTPVEDYGGEISEVIDEIYTCGYDNGKMDVDDGSYDEGFEDGKQEILSNSKYIPKQAVGKVISLTDVSEVSHKVKVVGVGNEVEVYGKNLFDISADTRFTEQADGSYINNVTLLNDKTSFVLPYNTYIVSYDLSCPAGKNARMEFTLGDGTTVSTYTPSTGDFVHIEKVITGEIVNWYFGYSSRPLEGELIIKNVQIEVGSIATAYEAYNKQTITATPMGTEISSMCPNMSFIANEEIKVDYYSSFGMQTEYDRFWDNLQQNGNRTNYISGFAYCWNDINFKPKYDIRCVVNGNQMFYACLITDLSSILKKQGVSIIIDNECANFSNVFQASKVTHLPELILPSKSVCRSLATNCYDLHTIDGLVCNENIAYENSFNGCSKLTHCIFSGVIASDINLQWSPLLDEESLQSLTQSLADFIMVDNNPTGTNIPEGQPFTKTLTLSPESWAILDNLEFIPPEGTGYPTGFSCTTVITTAKGWNKA